LKLGMSVTVEKSPFHSLRSGNFSGPLSGKSLDEMKRNFQVQLSEEFTSHPCAENPRTKGVEALSS
jgi:hypothetical protein